MSPKDDLQTFTGIAIFRLVLFVSLSLFSLFEVFRLHANKAKKNPFFSLQSEKKKGLFFAFFRFKRKRAAHPSPVTSAQCKHSTKNLSLKYFCFEATHAHVDYKMTLQQSRVQS
jgi:hypothetical protein